MGCSLLINFKEEEEEKKNAISVSEPLKRTTKVADRVDEQRIGEWESYGWGGCSV